MVFDHEGGNGFDFYFLHCILYCKTEVSKQPTHFLKDFEVYQFINGYIRECLFHMRQFSGSTFSQHSLMHFPITRGLRPLVIWGNASTCAEKKLNPRIASCGKDTFNSEFLESISGPNINSIFPKTIFFSEYQLATFSMSIIL